MATFDRAAQYQPIHALVDAAQKARTADDAATTAMDSQQAAVDDLKRQISLLASKVQPWGGATGGDYQKYGQLLTWLETEYGKLPDLQATQAATKVASDLARKAMRDAVDAVDINPGQQERS